MLQTALREDALTATPEGFELRLGLSWIRSMPLSSVAELAVEVDGIPVAPGDLAVVLGARRVRADALQAESGWWFVQDRLVLAGRRKLSRGVHAIAVDFQLLVPFRRVPVLRWSCRSIWRPGWSLTGHRCPASPATWPERLCPGRAVDPRRVQRPVPVRACRQQTSAGR